MVQLAAADVAQLGIWFWTPADNERVWNERMFDLYQLPPGLRDIGLTYEHWLMRIHPDDLQDAEGKLRAALGGCGVFDPVFRIVLPDGQVGHIQAGARIESADDGSEVRITAINRDITEQLQYETRLRDAKDAARQNQRFWPI